MVTLKDNRAPDPGPAGWELAWSDEFDDPAGTQPNPANWAYEIGDTTPDGKNGWGNEELQYYTDDPANAATDGNGNLVITLDEADGSQECYYGPCEFESARLITQNKAEFAYGRIESRLQVPDRRRRPVAGVLEPGHRHHLQPMAGRRRDRLHGVRQPDPERDLRHNPWARLQRRRQLRRHLGLRPGTGDQRLPHVHRRVGAEPDHLVRRRYPVPPGRAVRCARPVGLREAVLPAAQLRHRRQLRWSDRPVEHLPTGVSRRLRAGLPGTRHRRALRGHVYRQLRRAGSWCRSR